MATVTLYDGQTGRVIRADADTELDPVVSADSLAKVSLAVDPTVGRAFAQFVVEPDERRIVADLVPAEEDSLPDLYRAVRDRVDATDLTMSPPSSAPPHLNVFHYLANPDPYVPDPEIGAHLVSTDEPLEASVPNAVAATGVVAFFRGRAPWKTLAVQAPDAGVSTEDADVVVTIDSRYDGVTWMGRDESWVDDTAVPDKIEFEIGEEPASADGATAEQTTAGGGSPAAARSGQSAGESPPGRSGSPDAAGSSGAAGATGAAGTAGDTRSALRLFDGETGELVSASGPVEGASEEASAAARRRYDAGQVLAVHPSEEVVRGRLARTDGGDGGFFFEYANPGAGDALLASFAEVLSVREEDLGVSLGLDVGDDVVDCEHLAATPSRPDRLTEADVAYLERSDEPLDFAAPAGTTALGLALYLRGALDGDPSVAVSGTGRTDDLAELDVVVAFDADCEDIEPRGETATRLSDGRLREGLTSVGGTVKAVSNRVEEITGTVEAHQRVFAAALSSEPLAERGLTVAPVDDDPLYRRRKQARYLLLYGLVLAGVAAGVNTGRFDPLVALLDATYTVDLEWLATTPVSGLAGVYEVGGATVVGACALALVAGAYWLFGYPLGPLEALETLVKNVRKQVTGGVGSGTVPNSIAEVAEPVGDAIEELHAGYEHLSDVEGSVAGDAEDFAEFLEANLLTGGGLPSVVVVDRDERRKELVVGIVVGAVVGTVLAAAAVAGLWVVAGVAAETPNVVFDGLVGAVGLTVLASLVKAVLAKYGGGRLPQWPTPR